MFFEKYKSSYSLNFFAICGWLNLIGVMTFMIPPLFIEHESMDTLVTSLITLNWFFAIYATITFVIFMFEVFYEFKITNNNILNNVWLNVMRVLGIMLGLIPFVTLFLAFLFLKF